VVVNKVGKIICISFVNGKRHDFRLFKASRLKLDSEIKVVVDAGRIGIVKLHVNSVLPIKCSEKKSLPKTAETFNRGVLSERVLNEQIIGF